MAKENLFKMVTDRIIEELEKGNIPWEKPWTGTIDGAFNRKTKRPYSLINQLLLVKSGEWASLKQWNELGGKIKKGEKSSIVVFWKIQNFVKKEKDADGNEKESRYSVPVLKYYRVFHIDQVEGVEPLENRNLTPIDTVDDADEIIREYVEREGIRFHHEKQNKAFYRPSTDEVVLPMREQFTDTSEYYSTAFHELTHSTGHPSRLNRITKPAAFGSEDYSREELVAEIGAASMLNSLGIETKKSFRNSAAYIQSWIRALKNDERMIVVASGKAEKAVEFIRHGNGGNDDDV